MNPTRRPRPRRPTLSRSTTIPSRTHASLSKLVADQHGVISRRQLRAAGWTVGMIDHRVREGVLRVVHRGVYLHGALTEPLRPIHFREMAAVLACGPGALVSHQSAAGLWGMLERAGPEEPIHVIIPPRARARRPGIRVHRRASLGEADQAELENIRVTSPARTLVDLAELLPSRRLEQALARARREGLTTRRDVRAAMERATWIPGAPQLRRLLESAQPPALTRSKAEEKLLHLIRRSGLPAPECNARLGRFEVDFLWRRKRVALEVDGFAFHSSPRSFEADRRRDRALTAQGFRTVRTTWRQITDAPEALLVQLAQILTRAAS